MPKPSRQDIERLLVELGPRLWQLARRHCARAASLEQADFVQELRIRVWQALERDSTVTHWPAYLQRAAVSVVVDAQRRTLRAREVSLDVLESGGAAAEDATAEPDRRAQSAQSLELTLAALAALPERRRRPTALLLQGFTTEEIGTMLATSEATARNLAYRGLEELREALGAKAASHGDA